MVDAEDPFEFRERVFRDIGLLNPKLALSKEKQDLVKECTRQSLLCKNAERIYKAFIQAFGDPLYPREIIKDENIKLFVCVDISTNIFPSSGKRDVAAVIEELRTLIQSKLDTYSIELGSFAMKETANNAHGYLGEWDATLLRESNY